MEPGSGPEDLLADADRAWLRAKALGGRMIARTQSQAPAAATG